MQREGHPGRVINKFFLAEKQIFGHVTVPQQRVVGERTPDPGR